MPGEIAGVGREKVIFEENGSIYIVDLNNGQVSRVNLKYDSPDAILHGYWKKGKKFLVDSYFDDGCWGLSDPRSIPESEVPELVKFLLIEDKETALKKIQELISKYKVNQ